MAAASMSSALGCLAASSDCGSTGTVRRLRSSWRMHSCMVVLRSQPGKASGSRRLSRFSTSFSQTVW